MHKTTGLTVGEEFPDGGQWGDLSALRLYSWSQSYIYLHPLDYE